jgi:hypothetical protein
MNSIKIESMSLWVDITAMDMPWKRPMFQQSLAPTIHSPFYHTLHSRSLHSHFHIVCPSTESPFLSLSFDGRQILSLSFDDESLVTCQSSVHRQGVRQQSAVSSPPAAQPTLTPNQNSNSRAPTPRRIASHLACIVGVWNDPLHWHWLRSICTKRVNHHLHHEIPCRRLRRSCSPKCFFIFP